MIEKKVIGYVVKEGRISPDLVTLANNICSVNTWKITGSFDADCVKNGEMYLTEWKCENISRDLKVGTIYRNLPVVDHINKLLKLFPFKKEILVMSEF